MNEADFSVLAGVLRDASGLVLEKSRDYLAESRLAPVAMQHGCRDLSALVGLLRSTRRDVLIRDVVEAMATHESQFFRDKRPFGTFRSEILPEVMRMRGNRRSFNIWCAAAAAGQEPYSLAMILDEEKAKLAGWQSRILATDISAKVLAKAMAGTYSALEVQRGLSAERLALHFEKKDTSWQIKPRLSSLVQFRQFNLVGTAPMVGAFDIVFCRNVLIYFDQATKVRVLGRIAAAMVPEGFLVLGATETPYGVDQRFQTWNGQHGVYRLSGKVEIR